jgi:putative ABC transport system permease protein
MWWISLRMLVHKRLRCVLTIVGLAALFFLSAAQVGLLVGWCNTTSAIIRHSEVDLWVMTPLTPAFDYGSPIPLNRVYQVRSVPGVAWAEGMLMDWSMWQRPDGRRISVEIVGLDESSVGGPWEMAAGQASYVHRPDSVIVDQAFAQQLGVKKVGDDVELYGRRAVVRGFSRNVRTFTASPFVFTSLRSARRFDQRYDDDEITYVLARCAGGQDPQTVKRAIAEQVPDIEVCTTSEFANRTISYWMLETGVGITVVITAVLGFGVSAMVVSQTLFTVTNDYLPHYAMLSALGFHRYRLVSIVTIQSLVLGGCALLLGGTAFMYAARASASTSVPLETTPEISAGVSAAFLTSCLLSSFLSVRSVASVDPATVFRA